MRTTGRRTLGTARTAVFHGGNETKAHGFEHGIVRPVADSGSVRALQALHVAHAASLGARYRPGDPMLEAQGEPKPLSEGTSGEPWAAAQTAGFHHEWQGHS